VTILRDARDRHDLGPPDVGSAGPGCFYTDYICLMHGGRISLGEAVSFNHGCWINAAGGLTIGDRVLVGPRVMIHTANHRFDDPDRGIREQGHDMRPVVIGDDCWLAMGVMVLPGVTIGQGCVIGAGAVVTADVPDWSVVAGNPARVLRSRRPEST
jgi:maltose O-acetyltransferase